MIIALDYDGTYTGDPILWNEFIRNCKTRGHDIVVATMRNEGTPEEKEVIEAFSKMDLRIIFTNRKAKLNYLAELGIFPKIWIDDNPLWIYQNG